MPEPTLEPLDRFHELSRRSLLIGGAFTLASAVAFARQPSIVYPVVEADEFKSWIPDRLGPWKLVTASGVVLPPEDELSDRIYDNLVTRVYTAPDRPAIMLLLAYNNTQDGVLQVHRPEVCYPVGGFELSNAQQDDIVIGGTPVPANFFTASGPNRIEQVGYFTRVGGTFPRSWIDQRIAVIEANLAQQIPDGFMMRVSLLAMGQAEAKVPLSEFCEQFYTNSGPRLKRLLLGPYV